MIAALLEEPVEGAVTALDTSGEPIARVRWGASSGGVSFVSQYPDPALFCAALSTMPAPATAPDLPQVARLLAGSAPVEGGLADGLAAVALGRSPDVASVLAAADAYRASACAVS